MSVPEADIECPLALSAWLLGARPEDFAQVGISPEGDRPICCGQLMKAVGSAALPATKK